MGEEVGGSCSVFRDSVGDDSGATDVGAEDERIEDEDDDEDEENDDEDGTAPGLVDWPAGTSAFSILDF